MTRPDDTSTLRRIATARTDKEIRDAVSRGLRPLVKKIECNPEIKAKYLVMQNRVTGEVVSLGDFRGAPRGPDWEVVIPWTFRYPYSWPLPYAAYLLPSNLEEGEVVVLEDLIEDLVGSVWNQGDTYRLESCVAEWTGADFKLLPESNDKPRLMIG